MVIKTRRKRYEDDEKNPILHDVRFLSDDVKVNSPEISSILFVIC
jgi:hypothetical protein